MGHLSFIVFLSLSHTEPWESATREKWACAFWQKKTRVSAYSSRRLFSDGADSHVGHMITLITGLAYLVNSTTKLSCFRRRAEVSRVRLGENQRETMLRWVQESCVFNLSWPLIIDWVVSGALETFCPSELPPEKALSAEQPAGKRQDWIPICFSSRIVDVYTLYAVDVFVAVFYVLGTSSSLWDIYIRLLITKPIHRGDFPSIFLRELTDTFSRHLTKRLTGKVPEMDSDKQLRSGLCTSGSLSPALGSQSPARTIAHSRGRYLSCCVGCRCEPHVYLRLTGFLLHWGVCCHLNWNTAHILWIAPCSS